MNFLKDLCSPAELKALADRWHVAKLLMNGLSYREISKETGISLTTITRAARVSFDGSGGLRLALEKRQKTTKEE